MRHENGKLMGLGFASGIWESQQVKSSAQAVLTADGRLRVVSAASDIGTGTFTIMIQIAAETVGLPMEHVTFLLGDTTFPEGTIEGGSRTAASVGSAVWKVCRDICKELHGLARKMKHSPLSGADLDEVEFTDGSIRVIGASARSVRITDVMKEADITAIEKEHMSLPNYPKQMLYTKRVHSAVFAEVHVDEELGVVWVAKVVNAVAGGRVLNAKTARSQVIGGVVFGIGMALEEDSILDHRFGRFINHNYAEYHVPVNADVPNIEVIFVEEHDDVVSDIGVKGLGEIGVVGVAAAIGSAIFHATGKRVKDLPITPDKLL
jgi:xanthine dehydrogenase YagR molybdenum-binding subunit